MPKQHKRLYTVGDFWLVPPDEKYSDFGISWYDKSARQTRRLGLKHSDFEDAKAAIHKHALEHGDGRHKDELLLQTVQRYYLRYAQFLPSEPNVKDTIKFLTLYGQHDDGNPVKVSQFDADQQKKFIARLRVHGLADSTISRHFVDVFAALTYAVQFKNLEEKGIPTRLAKRFWGERTQPRKRKNAKGKRALSLQEWGALFDAAARLGEHSVRYLICALGTVGRPAAILQLTGQQIDLTYAIVDLNPPGRTQTKKRRPKVRACDTFLQWLQSWSVPAQQHCVNLRGRPMVTRNFIWWLIQKSGVQDCNPYTLRHSVSSWLAWKGVSKWERKKAMGHAKVDGGSTDTYTHYDPNYLRAVADALEDLFQAIAPHTRFNLLRRVIEDQGTPETLWESVPKALQVHTYQTLLTPREPCHEAITQPQEEAATGTGSTGSLPLSIEVPVDSLRETLIAPDAVYDERFRNELHRLPSRDGSCPSVSAHPALATTRQSPTGYSVAGAHTGGAQSSPSEASQTGSTRRLSRSLVIPPRNTRSPTLVPSLPRISLSFPTVEHDRSKNAWRVRGEDLLHLLRNHALIMKKSPVSWVSLEDGGDIEIFMKFSNLGASLLKQPSLHSIQNCAIEYKRKQ